MSSEGLNLEAIYAAIEWHNGRCPAPATEIHMNPYEADRLGWDEIRGLPVIGNPKIGTGVFRVLCPNSLDGGGKELDEEVPVETDAVTKERELTPA